MLRTGLYWVRSPASDGLPADDMVRQGRVLLLHDMALYPARLVPHLRKKGGAVPWQLNDGTRLASVAFWIELDLPFEKISQHWPDQGAP
jgi:hypothetical protein